MSPSSGSVTERIAVISVSGDHLMWVTEDEAHRYVRAGHATVVRRRGRQRMILAREGFHHHLRLDLAGRGTGLDHTRYSTRRESETNPPRVWTLLRLSVDLVPMRG